MNYFKYFPVIAYPDDTGASINITNFTERAVIQEAVNQHVTVLYDYVIQDGLRPDSVAQNVYGSPLYTWIILVVNNIFTLFDWPLTTEEFSNYITEKYGSVTAAKSQNLYFTTDGFAVDFTTWMGLGTEQGGVISAFDDEFNTNESKRRIKIVPPEFATRLTQELKNIL